MITSKISSCAAVNLVVLTSNRSLIIGGLIVKEILHG